MNHLHLRAYRWMKCLGLTGMTGIALLFLAAGGYFGMSLPAQSRMQKLTHEIAIEQMRQKEALLHPVSDSHSKGSDLQKFYEFFPARHNAPKLLAVLYKVAREESINLKNGEYKYTLGNAGGLVMYKVNFPVKGSYIQIRKFIVKVMNAVPSVALNEISFKRDIIGSTDLDAKISFTIYLKAV